MSKQATHPIIESPHKLGHFLGYEDLTEVHSRWIKNVWQAEKDYTLQAFRGSYKTTSVIVVGVIWYLLFEPEHRVLLVREDYGNAVATLGEIIRNYEKDEMKALYRELVGVENFQLKVKRHNSITLPTKRKTSREGSIEAIGIGGSLTGRHYEHIHTDDIMTIKDRISRAKREAVKTFCRELVNIPVPGGVTTHTGTPWHPDDAFTILPEPDKYPIGSIAIPGYNAERIAHLRRSLTPSLWASNYELTHISDKDRLFSNPILGDHPERLELVFWLDPAYGGQDTTALVGLGTWGDKLYGRGWVFPSDVMLVLPQIVQLAKDYKAGTIHVDGTADQGGTVRELGRLYPAVQNHKESLNKHIKIISYARKHWEDITWAKDTQPEFLQQIVDYEEGLHPDDAPDALACLLREMGVGGTDILERFS